jgi:hypothetical protein
MLGCREGRKVSNYKKKKKKKNSQGFKPCKILGSISVLMKIQFKHKVLEEGLTRKNR